jgi:hypothetical protein
MNIKKMVIVLIAALALMITACAPTATTSSPEASVAQPPSQSPAPTEAKATDSLKKFGEVMSWHDGVSISVSEPVPFEASTYAAGVVAGQTNVVYTLVMTNGTDKPIEPLVRASVSSGGAEASAIYDMGHALGDIGGSPTTIVLPGQTVKWLEAYSLVDPSAVTFQVSPTFMYDDAVFTNIKS